MGEISYRSSFSEDSSEVQVFDWTGLVDVLLALLLVFILLVASISITNPAIINENRIIVAELEKQIAKLESKEQSYIAQLDTFYKENRTMQLALSKYNMLEKQIVEVISAKLKATLNIDRPILVERPENDTINLQFPNLIFFDFGSYSINAKGRLAILETGKILSGYEDSIEKIEIIGHADATPVSEGAEYKDNLDLSCLRAAEVSRVLIMQGLVDKTKISAVCKSYFESDLDSYVDLKKKRRVDIKLKFK
jgi:flagellar motor protein MotB